MLVVVVSVRHAVACVSRLARCFPSVEIDGCSPKVGSVSFRREWAEKWFRETFGREVPSNVSTKAKICRARGTAGDVLILVTVLSKVILQWTSSAFSNLSSNAAYSLVFRSSSAS